MIKIIKINSGAEMGTVQSLVCTLDEKIRKQSVGLATDKIGNCVSALMAIESVLQDLTCKIDNGKKVNMFVLSGLLSGVRELAGVIDSSAERVREFTA